MVTKPVANSGSLRKPVEHCGIPQPSFMRLRDRLDGFATTVPLRAESQEENLSDWTVTVCSGLVRGQAIASNNETVAGLILTESAGTPAA